MLSEKTGWHEVQTKQELELGRGRGKGDVGLTHQGVKIPFLLAVNSGVSRKLRMRNFFQLLTPENVSVQSQLESDSLTQRK